MFQGSPAPPSSPLLGYPERFHAAVEFVRQQDGGKHMNPDTQLLLYGLWHQAIKGPCNLSKPGGWGWAAAEDLTRWQAWKGLGDMSANEAMRLYVRTVEEDQPKWLSLLQQSTDAAGPNSSASPARTSEKARPAAEYAVTSAWTTVPNTSQRTPMPRYEHAAAMLGQHFCLVGGNYGGRYLNDVWRLNVKTMEWTQVQTRPYGRDDARGAGAAAAATAAAGASPKVADGAEPAKAVPALQPIAGHTVTAWNDSLILLGGHSKAAKGSQSSLAVQVMNLSGEVATLACNGTQPPPRGSHTASLLGHRIYVFGGEDPQRRPLGDVWYLDVDTLTWGQPTTTGKAPSARSAHAAAAYQGRYLLVFGGGSVATCHSDLHVLDTHAIPMQWRQPKVTGLKVTSRAGHTGVIVGSVWYIVGGGNNVKGCTDMLALDLTNIESGDLSWSSAASIPARDPLSSEGISVAQVGTTAPAEAGQPQEYVLLGFGGYNGKYHNAVSVIQVPDAVPHHAGPVVMTANGQHAGTAAAAASTSSPAAASQAAAPPPAVPPAPRRPTDAELLVETRARAEAAERGAEAALKEAADAKEAVGHELALLRKQVHSATVAQGELQKELESAKASLSREREKVMRCEAEIAELNKRLALAAEVQKEVESLRRALQEAESKKASGGVWGYISGQS